MAAEPTRSSHTPASAFVTELEYPPVEPAMALDRRESAELAPIREAVVTCAVAEGLLRGMLVRLDFSADELLVRHLSDLERSLDAIAEKRLGHPSLQHLAAARDALLAACSAFDPWRFSTDPEYSHLPLFQRESLRLLETASSEREAAAAHLP